VAAAHPNAPTINRRMPWLTRAAWYIVLTMMLAAAAWSIAHRLHAWGMASWLAWSISLMFDCSALVCAEYARRAVTRGTPAGLPRLAILLFVAASGVITYTHGHAIGGIPAGIAFASTSAFAELLFELNRRDVRDTERHVRGLVPEMLPRIPFIAWVMYPGRSWKTLRKAVKARLATVDPVAVTQDAAPVPVQRADGTVRAAVRAARDTMPNATAEDIVDQLADLNIEVDEDTVRDIVGRPRNNATGQGRRRSTPSLAVVADEDDEEDGSIAATVRGCVRRNVLDLDDVLSQVRQVHGQNVRRATVRKSLDRATGRAAS
jgi:hypothetical protein